MWAGREGREQVKKPTPAHTRQVAKCQAMSPPSTNLLVEHAEHEAEESPGEQVQDSCETHCKNLRIVVSNAVRERRSTTPGRWSELAANMPNKATVGTDRLWRELESSKGLKTHRCSAYAGASTREMLHECAHAARASL